MLDLGVVQLALPRADLLARRLERLVALPKARVQAVELGLRRGQACAELLQALLERFDLGLAHEKPRIGGIGGVQGRRMGSELMPLAVHEHRPGRHLRKRGRPLGDIDAGEPVAQHPGISRVADMDLGKQAFVAFEHGRRARASTEKACLGGGRVRNQRLNRDALGELERMEPLAQDGLDGVLPARIDTQLLPKGRDAGEAMALEPVAKRRVVLGGGLDLAQRRDLRLDRGMLALRPAQGFGCERLARFDFRDFGLQGFTRGFGG